MKKDKKLVFRAGDKNLGFQRDGCHHLCGCVKMEHNKGQRMYFQDVILTLQNYWAGRGCVIEQASGVECGAGTFNPSTFLRVLGPEPWKVAYVEPSRRPTDGRYGENPNRLQRYFQFQVVLKPSPDNVQDLYLQSLEALGLNPARHDIRFVEDNWESPTLGAWAGRSGSMAWK